MYRIGLLCLCLSAGVSHAQTVAPTTTEDGAAEFEFLVRQSNTLSIPSEPREFADEDGLRDWLRDNLGVYLISVDAENFQAVWLGGDYEDRIAAGGITVKDPVMAILAGETGRIMVGGADICLDIDRGCDGPFRSYMSQISTEGTNPEDLPETARACSDSAHSFCVDVRAERRGITMTAKTSMKWGATERGRVIVGAYFEEDQDSKIVALRDEDGSTASETVRVWERNTKDTTLWCGYHWAESGNGKVIGPVQTAWDNPKYFGNENLVCPDPEILFDTGGGGGGGGGNGGGDDMVGCADGYKMCEPPPFLVCVPEGRLCP